MEDTIAAVSTAPGPSGIGIIRISGPDAETIADKVFTSKSGVKLKEKPSYTITYGIIVDEEKKVIDEALALVMRGPSSFTGEDVVELQCHGGVVLLHRVLELVLRAGARMAEPGEFSKRAFLNGKLDLSQTEAIMDIINAKTVTAVKAAVNNLRGAIHEEIKSIRGKLLENIAHLEADIDFPEEDFIRIDKEQVMNDLIEIERRIEKLIASYNSGRIVQNGLKTALIGKPNVGKSSLLNALIKEKRAIVTDIPGTTRDTIEEYYNLGGIPLILVDTAGIRETKDIIERLGVEKTKETIKDADLILYVLDIAEGITDNDLEFIKEFPEKKMLIVINKIDLLHDKEVENKIDGELPGYHVLYISAKEGTGLKELEEKIKQLIFKNGLEAGEEPLITNIRQKDALVKAGQAVASAREGLIKKTPSDLISLDLKQAWLNLGEITGETLDENIIDQIFSQFCLGK
ncbi:MAG: tRNA uridine-5-carboxymethylaminomethyl(34) synthesis GTPase MnmE [Peptococcaceae bacterium]|jgi:tRNA modification GTPase|nr:tRNA uridine-5-carboxymethylaminomethyl(34) synthesis GTPase MnmE [Peptococcaceae bacterium]MDH7523820.1 tRNA uridine-5-carboxymethylaminomethyl(34) synthesis GTPase MnmE [Peptococcaceae bacterium]